jgi:hypothetical protein
MHACREVARLPTKLFVHPVAQVGGGAKASDQQQTVGLAACALHHLLHNLKQDNTVGPPSHCLACVHLA